MKPTPDRMAEPPSELDERARSVRDLIHASSVTAATTTLPPVPLLDIVLITPIHVAMVQGIGRLHGYRLDRKSVLEILKTVRISLLTQNAVLAATRLVPVLGSLVAISVAYAFTYALGEMSDRYFRSGRTTPAAELRRMFVRIYRDKRRYDAARYRELGSLRANLAWIREMRARHRLTDQPLAKPAAEDHGEH